MVSLDPMLHPSVSISVKRGEKIAKTEAIRAYKELEGYNFMGVPDIPQFIEGH